MDRLDELQQLQSPLHRLTVQSYTNHEKLAKLKRELAQHEEETRALDRTCKPYLLYYARKDCLQLANMMHRKLPAELRELVYEHLCVEPDRPIPVGPYYHFRPYDQPHRDMVEPWPGGIHDVTDFAAPVRANHPSIVVGPDAYAAHALVDRVPEVDMEVVPETVELSQNPQQGPSSQPFTSREIQITPELAERVSKMSRLGDNEHVVFDDNITILPDGRVKETHTHEPPSDMVLPSSHILNPRYVGQAVSHEIQKMYYMRNTFSVCTVEQAIARFSRDHSGHHMLSVPCRVVPRDLRLDPPFYPRDHVRNLQVRVKCEHFWEHRPRHPTKYEAYAYELRFLRFATSNIEGLCGFLHKRSEFGINLEFVILTSLPSFDDDEFAREAECNFANLLQTIRNTVYRMILDCNDISVKVVHYDTGHSPFPRDITGVFSLTKTQWEYEKSVHGRDDWTQDFYLATPGLDEDRDKDKMSFGYRGSEVTQMLLERWGMESILDTRSRRPIQEGRYWPKAPVTE